MSSHTVPQLFVRLVDDAGLFPPEQLPMASALARHRLDETEGSPVLTGRFLCAAADFGELLEHLLPLDRLRLGLISPLGIGTLQDALDRIAGDPRVQLAGVEGPLADPDALAVVPEGVPCYVEVPRGDVKAIARVAEAGYGVKVRCGGLRPELFPTAQELATFVTTCAQVGVPFKATAGLHHALPYADPRTGLSHHGFLNLLLATCRAVQGADDAAVTAAIDCTDRAALVREAHGIEVDVARAARRIFVAYGSCSTREPAADLRTLGLLATTEIPE